MIRFINDPLPIICAIAQELKPDIDCIVQYRQGLEGAGCTTFPDDGGTILIEINADIPIIAGVEILAHELAHVIVGKADGDGHTAEWESTFDLIFRLYEQKISEKEAVHV